MAEINKNVDSKGLREIPLDIYIYIYSQTVMKTGPSGGINVKNFLEGEKKDKRRRDP